MPVTVWLLWVACTSPLPEHSSEAASTSSTVPSPVTTSAAHVVPAAPPPEPAPSDPLPPSPDLEGADLLGLVQALANLRPEVRSQAALALRRQEYPAEQVEGALVGAYGGAPATAQPDIARVLLGLAPEAYPGALGAQEQARLAARLDEDPRVTIPTLVRHAKAYPAGASLIIAALGHADPAVRNAMLGRLDRHGWLPPDLYAAVAAQLDYPPHRDAAELLLEATRAPEAQALVEAHAHAEVSVPPPTDPVVHGPLPAPLVPDVSPHHLTVTVSDIAEAQRHAVLTVVSPQGVEHLPLAYARRHCADTCGAALAECELQLRFRRSNPADEPRFVFRGRWDLGRVEATPWTLRPTDDGDCTAWQSGSFSKTQCGAPGRRTAELAHDGEVLLSTYEDYGSGGTADLPLVARHGGEPLFLFEGLAKFRKQVGWLTIRDGTVTTEVAERWVNTICDVERAFARSAEERSPSDGGLWYAIVERPSGHIEIVRSSQLQDAPGEVRFVGSHRLTPGPVAQAEFGNGCVPLAQGWPARVGAPCVATLGSVRYRFERIEVQDHTVFRVARVHRDVQYTDVATLPTDQADALRVRLAADVDRDGEIDLLLRHAPDAATDALHLSLAVRRDLMWPPVLVR